MPLHLGLYHLILKYNCIFIKEGNLPAVGGIDI